VQIPDQENLGSVDELIKLALANRPDFTEQKIGLTNSEINLKGTNNGLLPTLDLFAFYGGTGLAGQLNPRNPGAAAAGAPIGGFGDAFGNVFNGSAPDRGLGINLNIPIGNRVAQATQIRSRLEYRQAQLGLKSLENQIAIFVRQDAFTVEQNRAHVAAAQKAQVLAQQTLDAEQKKYNLGASTYLAVLSDERDLAQAESNLVSAMTNYAKAKVQLDRDTAQTLGHLNIKIDEATTGEIKTQPTVPGTVVNKNALQDMTNPGTLQQPIQVQPATPQPTPAPQPTPPPKPPQS
jgi:outer membrane protein TolC